jgi:large subunit ribosomal protein L30
MAKKLKIKQVRSLIDSNKRQRATIAALGLKRINHVVELNDTPQIRGMVNKVLHLVQVEETKG